MATVKRTAHKDSVGREVAVQITGRVYMVSTFDVGGMKVLGQKDQRQVTINLLEDKIWLTQQINRRILELEDLAMNETDFGQLLDDAIDDSNGNGGGPGPP